MAETDGEYRWWSADPRDEVPVGVGFRSQRKPDDTYFIPGRPSTRMAITGLELLVLLVVLAFFFGAYRIIRTVRPFIVNAVVGLLALVLLGWFGFGVEITSIVLVIVALGGVPGALLVVLLAYLGIVFTPVVLI